MPDEKTTYYPITSLIVAQLYELLIEEADGRGGALKVPVDFFLEEFGNFAVIPDLIAKTTAARSRGIRFYFVIQSFFQLLEKYNENIVNTLKENVKFIYLKSDHTDTHKAVSEMLDSYTTRLYSTGETENRNQAPSLNQSQNLGGRPLLYPSEVAKLKEPYGLAFKDGERVLINLPDLAKLGLNQVLDLGDKEHNARVFFERNQAREIKHDENIALSLWSDLWDSFTVRLENETTTEKIPFDSVKEANLQANLKKDKFKVKKKGY